MSNFQTFWQKQWQHVIQPFTGTQFEYPEIEDDRILPFLPNDEIEAKGNGNFSIVQPAQMLKDYQDVLDNVRFLRNGPR